MKTVLSQLVDGPDLAHRAVMNLTDYRIDGYEAFSNAIMYIRGGLQGVSGRNESTITYDAWLKTELMDN